MKRNIQITRPSGKWTVLLLAALFATMYTYDKATGTSFAAPINPPGACILDDADFNTEDGGCKDLATGIVWSDGTSLAQYSWAPAVEFCNNLDEGGYSDWVLPTKDEMIEAALNGASGHINIHAGNFSYHSRTVQGNNWEWTVRFTDGSARKSLRARTYCPPLCTRHPDSSGSDAPSDLTATTVSSSEIDLAWIDKSSDENGFEIERSLDGVNWPSAPTATVGPNVGSYPDTGLTKKTTYYYRVRASGPSGYSDYSNTDSSKTTNR